MIEIFEGKEMDSNYELMQSNLISLGLIQPQEQERVADTIPFIHQLREHVNRGGGRTFVAGQELLSYPPAAASRETPTPSTGWLIVQGRVRLLSVCNQRPQFRSATVLQVGEILGADHWFYSTPLPYTAIAASSCEMMPISETQVSALTASDPSLAAAWRSQMQQRAQQIFFKRYTCLQSLPSHLLRHLLLPRIHTIDLEAGQPVRTALVPYEGYFWLGFGEVCCSKAPEQRLKIGAGWRDRDHDLADWVADGPTQLYQLRVHPWEIAELRPVLDRLGWNR